MFENQDYFDDIPLPESADDYYTDLAPVASNVEAPPVLSQLGHVSADDEGSPAHVRVSGGDVNALREWVFLSSSNSFFNMRTGEKISRIAFDLALVNETPFVEVTKRTGETETKKFSPSRTLVEFLGGDVVFESVYFPGNADIITREGVRLVNAYLQSQVPTADPDWGSHDAWRVVEGHIRNVLPDGADTIVMWLAHNVQRPGTKITWAPVLVGVEGDGKTTIGNDILAAAMGSRHVKPVSAESMFSDFTGWATDACVRVLEEIRIQGERRTAVMDKLKPMITNGGIEIVRKGKDGFIVPNITNYIALTNHIDALPVNDGDRRWAIYKTRFADRAEMLAETGKEYWSRIRWAIEHHPGVIRAWLLNVDISDFDRTQAPPITDAKLLMIEASRSSVSADVREVLALGGFGVSSDVVATDCVNQRIKELGGRTISTSVMSGILSEAGWVKHVLTVKWRGVNRRLYYRPESFAGLADLELSRALRAYLDGTDDGGTR